MHCVGGTCGRWLLSGPLRFAVFDGPGEAECPAARAPGHLGMDLRAWQPQALTGIAVCTAPGLVGKVSCKSQGGESGWKDSKALGHACARPHLWRELTCSEGAWEGHLELGPQQTCGEERGHPGP